MQEIPQIQERINERKQLLAKYKYQLQAIPVFLGPLGGIRQSFIVLDNYRWEVGSPIEAIEGTFHLAFGLESQYPIESRHIWLYLQRTLYGIKTPDDFARDPALKSFLAARFKDFDLYNSK